MNTAQDGHAIKLADPAGSFTEWRLEYSDLSDSEAGALRGVLHGGGRVRCTTSRSSIRRRTCWRGTRTSTKRYGCGTIAGSKASAGYTQLNNTGGGPQSITQTIATDRPGICTASASMRVRRMRRPCMCSQTDRRREQAIVPEWRRLRLVGDVDRGDVRTGDPAGGGGGRAGAASGGAGGSVGGQDEHDDRGRLQGARLRDDRWLITTGREQASCTVNIVHANHI